MRLGCQEINFQLTSTSLPGSKRATFRPPGAEWLVPSFGFLPLVPRNKQTTQLRKILRPVRFMLTGA